MLKARIQLKKISHFPGESQSDRTGWKYKVTLPLKMRNFLDSINTFNQEFQQISRYLSTFLVTGKNILENNFNRIIETKWLTYNNNVDHNNSRKVSQVLLNILGN